MDMARHPRAVLCERARSWAALAPDGELSELERKLLDSHLQRCGACGHFAVQVAAIAAELREAALQPLPQPVSVPVWRRRPVYARFRAVGAAAAVALMALGVASRAPLAPGEQSATPLPQVTNFANGAPEREVELIARRVENIAASQTRFRPKKPSVVMPT
jgi:predicted anti-sigma-YlaC factor YlaD